MSPKSKLSKIFTILEIISCTKYNSGNGSSFYDIYKSHFFKTEMNMKSAFLILVLSLASLSSAFADPIIIKDVNGNYVAVREAEVRAVYLQFDKVKRVEDLRMANHCSINSDGSATCSYPKFTAEGVLENVSPFTDQGDICRAMDFDSAVSYESVDAPENLYGDRKLVVYDTDKEALRLERAPVSSAGKVRIISKLTCR
jgi:hypothetical protein